MNGTFIAETIKGERYVNWSRLDCSNSANRQENSFTSIEETHAETDVTVQLTKDEKKIPAPVLETKPQVGALLLYPSPNSGRFNIKLPQQIANAEIIIINQTGAEISRTKASNLIKNQELTCDISRNPNGFYLIRIITEKGTFIKSFIKSE